MTDEHLTTDTVEADLGALHTLAGLVAFELAPGDGVLLEGDLGAGKTTFARALIRQAAGDDGLEVPSPTFPLVQSYDTPRLRIAHFDLYRLGGPDEAREIGLEDAAGEGAVIVEWPDRAPDAMPESRLEIALLETSEPGRRQITLTGRGRLGGVLARTMVLYRVLVREGWSGAGVGFLQGDASPRRYARLSRPADTDAAGFRVATALLMDSPRRPDGPPIRDGLPYSRIAHIAEDVRPFVAVGRYLDGIGLSAPQIHAADLEQGVLIIEDLGAGVFGAELARGADQRTLWTAAVDALLALHAAALQETMLVADGVAPHRVPAFDCGALGIEVELLTDWYIPLVTGRPAAPEDAAAFLAAWANVFAEIGKGPRTLVLRDYHSPNLIWLPERAGARRVGIIDFQDAMIGHPAYDLVSLLQDARLDVPETLEEALLQRYLAAAGARDPAFDAAQFTAAYRMLGAQRNTKILGIFARLARRDGKPLYLGHIPRIWGYLARDLKHASLAPLRAWYDRVLPATVRGRGLVV